MSQFGPGAMNLPTFRKIEARLAGFSPSIRLRDYIVDKPASRADLEVHPLTLQGVDFTVKNPDKFVADLEAARTGTDKAFSPGSSKAADWKQHWAMSASLQATRGLGFREPWRYTLTDHGMRLQDARPKLRDTPEMDDGFAGHFGLGNKVDLSALHVSVAFGKWTECNIHIDETGVAMAGPNGDVSITLNAVPHLFNELIFKTFGGEKLPTWFIDRVNLRVLSPEMGYGKIGLSADILKGESYKLTISASCGLTSCPDIAFSKVLKLDTDALKSLNPTINFTKRF